ncbi:MAG: DUF4135 domain-containing protein [Chlamydiales bacterium]
MNPLHFGYYDTYHRLGPSLRPVSSSADAEAQEELPSRRVISEEFEEMRNSLASRQISETSSSIEMPAPSLDRLMPFLSDFETPIPERVIESSSSSGNLQILPAQSSTQVVTNPMQSQFKKQLSILEFSLSLVSAPLAGALFRYGHIKDQILIQRLGMMISALSGILLFTTGLAWWHNRNASLATEEQSSEIFAESSSESAEISDIPDTPLNSNTIHNQLQQLFSYGTGTLLQRLRRGDPVTEKQLELETENLVNRLMIDSEITMSHPENIGILIVKIGNVIKNENYNDVTKSRIIFNLMEQFRNNMMTISERVSRDREEIGSLFFPGQSCQFLSIEMTSDETHHRGQVPCYLWFQVENQGAPQRVVYKPRDIRADESICSASNNSLFSIVSDFINQPMPVYRFLSKTEGTDHYGYVEFLTHSRTPEHNDYCLDIPEMINFYQMYGRIQALAQIFCLYDLHYHNIIVHNKLPHLIDTEASYDPIHFYHHGDTTDLELAIIDTQEGGEHQVTLNHEGEEHPLPTYFMQNDPLRELMYRSIQEGYQEICNLCQKDERLQARLHQFLDQLPADLIVRLVPMATGALSFQLSMIPLNVEPLVVGSSSDERSSLFSPLADQILSNIEGGEGTLTKEERDAIIQEESRELFEDFSRQDIPVIQLAARSGLITHNNRPLLSRPSQFEEIHHRISSPPTMSIKFMRTIELYEGW